MSVKKSVNALEYCKNSSGCLLRNGQLFMAFTCEKISGDHPYGVKFSTYSDAIKRYIVCNDNAVYVSETVWNFKDVCAFNCEFPPFMVEKWGERDAEAVIISGSYAVVLSGGSADKLNLGASLSCGVMHCGRLFGADAYDGLVLRWSGADAITDWTAELHGSGFLKLDPERGEIIDMLIFNGKIVAVREHGLTVLSMYGSPENFSVELTDTDCDTIFRNTAKITNGKLYFYSVSGLKCFDGNKISIIELNHSLSKVNGCAVYGNKYFLCGASETAGTDVIMYVDLANGENCVIKEYAENVFASDAVYCSAGGVLHELKDGGGYYFFESDPIDFGTGRLKTITKIDVQGTVNIRISNGKYKRGFNNASGVIRPHMRGKSFIIELDGASSLKGLTVTAEVTDAV
ncbi:MAG: hypothetical protein K2N23_01920 [Clostridia bacterium]|nr:hypothetical protein [Clostridia bacterium]